MSTGTQQPPEQVTIPKPEMPMVVVHHLAALFGAPRTSAVLYYPHGDRNEEPFTAFVGPNGPGGILTLDVVRDGSIRTISPVRHIDDPWFREHDAIRTKDGAWDWAPGNRPRNAPKAFPIQVETCTPEIVRLWNNNVTDPEAIANRIKGMLTATVRDSAGREHRVLVEDPLTMVQVAMEGLNKKK